MCCFQLFSNVTNHVQKFSTISNRFTFFLFFTSFFSSDFNSFFSLTILNRFASVLLSAHTKRFKVSPVRDFFLLPFLAVNLLFEETMLYLLTEIGRCLVIKEQKSQ